MYNVTVDKFFYLCESKTKNLDDIHRDDGFGVLLSPAPVSSLCLNMKQFPVELRGVNLFEAGPEGPVGGHTPTTNK